MSAGYPAAALVVQVEVPLAWLEDPRLTLTDISNSAAEQARQLVAKAVRDLRIAAQRLEDPEHG